MMCTGLRKNLFAVSIPVLVVRSVCIIPFVCEYYHDLCIFLIRRLYWYLVPGTIPVPVPGTQLLPVTRYQVPVPGGICAILPGTPSTRYYQLVPELPNRIPVYSSSQILVLLSLLTDDGAGR